MKKCSDKLSAKSSKSNDKPKQKLKKSVMTQILKYLSFLEVLVHNRLNLVCMK